MAGCEAERALSSLLPGGFFFLLGNVERCLKGLGKEKKENELSSQLRKRKEGRPDVHKNA